MNDTIERRHFGENTTFDTRSESHEKVDKQKRYRQILEILNGHELSAKEIADIMYQKGLIPTNERNFTAPRLTEMAEKGKVEPVGKKVCQWTGKKVAVYAVRVD
jgi:hypothetical protein